MAISKIDGIQPIGLSPVYDQVLMNPVESAVRVQPVKDSPGAESKSDKFFNIDYLTYKSLGLREQKQRLSKEIKRLIEEMTTFRRTLPPFPPGSEERIRILKGYIGIRKLIEKLTLPPERGKDPFIPPITLPDLEETASDEELDKALSGLKEVLTAIES